MDYMKDIQEISDEQAVILWQASRLSLSGKYEKAPEILRNPLILILFMDQWVVAGGLGGVGRLWWKKGRFRRVGLGT